MKNRKKEIIKWWNTGNDAPVQVDMDIIKGVPLHKVKARQWEEVMVEKCKVPLFGIMISGIPNLFESNIILLDNDCFEIKDLGITFTAIFDNRNCEDYNAEGLDYQEGRCKCLADGIFSESKKTANIITLKFENMPEWKDNGRYYDISNWIDYCLRYQLNIGYNDPEVFLNQFIQDNFGVESDTAKRWIEEKTVPKSFQEKVKAFYFKYSNIINVAEKMYP